MRKGEAGEDYTAILARDGENYLKARRRYRHEMKRKLAGVVSEPEQAFMKADIK